MTKTRFPDELYRPSGTEFVVKDNGDRQKFDSGMVRDTEEGKCKWHLVSSGPMLKRWAEHLTAGAKKYDDDNWMKASGEAELQRFRKSAFRHFMQWYAGERDEDHAAAVIFNLNGSEYVRDKMTGPANAASTPADYPVFLHDCENCAFLGRFIDCDVNYELYFCKAVGALIARHGEGANYLSAAQNLLYVGHAPALFEARRRAVERGLLSL